MNPAGAFIQIVLLIVSIVIGVTYLKPTFIEIQSLQDEKQRYIEERTRVDEVNRLLQSLVSEYESVRIEDLRRLNDYIPNSVDKLEVMRTLMAIGEESEVDINSISLGDGSSYDSGGGEDEFQTVEFSVELSGEYEKLKPFLARLERNITPILISNVELGPDANQGDTEEIDADEYIAASITFYVFSLLDIVDQTN